MSFYPRPGAIFALIFLMVSAPTLAQETARLAPHISLSPEQVVRIQLDALADNDEPYGDHGIEVTYRFASLGNKVFTGPLGRFKQMIRGPIFGPMIGHRAATVESVTVEDGEAVVDVVLRTAAGDFAGYQFRLSRQRGGACDGCWMTDGVVPTEVTSI
jgi:hypothetical protein